MAKLSYTKLNIKPEIDIKNLEWNNEIIEIKTYLSIDDKLKLIASVIGNAADGNRFVNPAKVDVFFMLEVITTYTNITFTEKQKEDPGKLYDAFTTSGLYNQILDRLPIIEISNLRNLLDETIQEIYKYNNSALGILESITEDYKDINFDAADLNNKIADPNNLTLLKSIMTKLG